VCVSDLEFLVLETSSEGLSYFDFETAERFAIYIEIELDLRDEVIFAFIEHFVALCVLEYFLEEHSYLSSCHTIAFFAGV
jgi:hypothetical protein